MSGGGETGSAARIDAFVDAAFAFAVTLLIISVGNVPSTLAELDAALGLAPAYAASFALLMVFWLGHHGFSRLAGPRSGLSLLLSLAIVFVVLIYVFPLKLVSQSAMHFLSGGQLPGERLVGAPSEMSRLYVIFGAGITVLAALYVGLFLDGARAARSPDARAALRDGGASWLFVGAAGLLSILAAVFIPIRGPVTGALPGFLYWLIPIAIGLHYGRRRRAVAAAAS